MARDYKHRAQRKRSTPSGSGRGVAWWKWLLVIILIGLFVLFLNFLKTETADKKVVKVTQKSPLHHQRKKESLKTKHQNKKLERPRYDFYTLLPKAEVVVPDYEIKTRSREERVGKAKPTQYLLQAGSFREFAEADKLRARLALMGIESHVEKTRIGNTLWNRVKIGPFTRSSSVASITKRLHYQGIDVIVTEKPG